MSRTSSVILGAVLSLGICLCVSQAQAQNANATAKAYFLPGTENYAQSQPVYDQESSPNALLDPYEPTLIVQSTGWGNPVSAGVTA